MDNEFDVASLPGLTLSEAMDIIPPKTIVNIGAKSNFLFIGVPRAWKHDRNMVNALAIELWIRPCDTAKRKLLKISIAISDAALAKNDDRRKRLLDNYSETMQEFQDSLARLQEYAPLENRKITDAYWRINHDDGINIIVEGDEVGKFWTRKEYLEWKTSRNTRTGGAK